MQRPWACEHFTLMSVQYDIAMIWHFDIQRAISGGAAASEDDRDGLGIHGFTFQVSTGQGNTT